MQAAILQQTAQYIITLEREKTQLLTQVCQLKRLVDQQDGGIVDIVQSTTAPQNGQTQITTTQNGTTTMITTNQAPNLKKRKLDTIYTMQAISDSSDEGLGSMSPEPTVLTNNNNDINNINNNNNNNNQTSTGATTITTSVVTTTTTQPSNIITKQTISAKDYIDIKNALETERRKSMALEEQLRQRSTSTIYTGRNGTINGTKSNERITYQHEVIEHTDNIRSDDDNNGNVRTVVVGGDKVHVLTLDPNIGGAAQVLMQIDDEHDMVDGNGMHHMNDFDDDDSRTMSPMLNTPAVKEEYINDSPPHTPVDQMQQHSINVKTTNSTIRLQPILEAAIKAEPKVEVERIHSPSSITVLKETNATVAGGTVNGNAASNQQTTTNGNRLTRMYPTNTSRQNLETIVEAIRHLEGDHLFGEQDAPLALTNKPQQRLHQQQQQPHQQQIQMDIINPFLEFRSSSGPASASAIAASIITTTSNASLSPVHIQTGITTTALQSQITHQHSPLLHSHLQHPKNHSTVPVAASSPISIYSHPHPHSINNRPGVIVVKQNS